MAYSQDHSIGEQEETGVDKTLNVMMLLAIDSRLCSTVATIPAAENAASRDGKNYSQQQA